MPLRKSRLFERTFSDGTRMIRGEFPDGSYELVLELDGKRVSRTIIVPTLMRIGAAVLRMDGIGGVESNAEYRNRGYSRRVMEACVDVMTAGDASLSTLSGIRDYYTKFGYATVGPEATVIIWIPDAEEFFPGIPEGWSVRDCEPADLPSIQRIYHLQTQSASCAIVRNSEDEEDEENAALIQPAPAARRVSSQAWTTLQKQPTNPGGDSCRVVLDETGEIVAYAWSGNDENWWMSERLRDAPQSFHFSEVMAVDPRAADAVVAACRLWAIEGGRRPKDIRLAIAPEGPVANAAALEGGKVLLEHTRDGDFMGRVLDVGRLLTQMCPEFTARIRKSSPAFRGKLVFQTEIGDGAIEISPEKAVPATAPGEDVQILELPQAMLARLCLGGFETEDVIARLPVKPTGIVQEILTILFPKRNPHMYPLDRF